MKVSASIEARMGSSRLPGKVLMDINGKPALTRLLDRLKKSNCIDDIVLATTDSINDDVLVDWAVSQGIKYFRGSENDVLNRVYNAHKVINSDVIVEITGDCPLIEPQIIDMGIEIFMNNDCDVVNNVSPVSFPQGVDVQVFKFSALEHVESHVHDVAVREHVSLYFYENPELYKIINLIAPKCWKAPELRFQLDYEEDLNFIRTIYEELEPEYGPYFDINKIMMLLNEKPFLKKINSHCIEMPSRK